MNSHEILITLYRLPAVLNMIQRIIKPTILLNCLAVALFFSACSKEDDNEITGTAKITVTHAATEAPPLDAYIDDVKITTVPLAFGNTTGTAADPYLAINAGLRYLKITPDNINNVIQGNVPFAPDAFYSIFAYDSIGVAGTLKTLILSDNLATPEVTKTNIRFLQLSPDTGRINVELVNTTDTVIFSSRAYLGTLATDAGLANFSAINAGDYTLNVRTTGTANPVLYSIPLTLSEGKIYTIYARGKKANGFGTPQGFTVNSISHN